MCRTYSAWDYLRCTFPSPSGLGFRFVSRLRRYGIVEGRVVVGNNLQRAAHENNF
jgi:hypothetical protein